MSKRGENIHKRKDGRWEARYKIGRKADGKIHYGYVYAKSYGKVKEKLLRTQSCNNNSVMKISKSKTFADAANMWIDSNKLRLKGGTTNKYINILSSHLLPQLGGYKLSHFTSTSLNAYLSEKLKNGKLNGKGGLSPSYVNSIRIVLNAIIKFAVNEQMMSPLNNSINKPNITKPELTIFSADEQRCIEAELTRNIDYTKLGVLISLHTGLRIGEVCALKWEDIDLINKTIHVRHTISRVRNELPNAKTKTILVLDTPKTESSRRDIPISSWLYNYLILLANTTKSVYVISNTNMFVSPRTYEYRYHKILNNCKVHSVNYHALRHTFATRCIEAGVDVKSLSEILGHSNVGITLNTYVHSSMELKRSQIEKMNPTSSIALSA